MNRNPRIKNVIPDSLADQPQNVDELVKEFIEVCSPLESDLIYVLVDAYNNARFCECHICAEADFPGNGSRDGGSGFFGRTHWFRRAYHPPCGSAVIWL